MHRHLFALLFLFTATPVLADEADCVSTLDLQPAVQVDGQGVEHWSVQERMQHYGVTGVSVAVLRDGKPAWTCSLGVLQEGNSDQVDSETVFSVGSLSKVGAAAVILRMADAGILDLDTDVNLYLKRWQLPNNELTQGNPVTLRRLLSHTAGTNVRGFPDFLPGKNLPTIVEMLEGTPPAVVGPVRVINAPGSRANYSGGGVTIEQLVVEDVLGIDFEAAARRFLFAPLGMTRSTYAQPLDPSFGNIAKAHDARGQGVALPRGYQAMPETAASGLWTTSSDYGRMVAALIASYRGVAGAFLSQPLAQMMMTEVAPSPVGLGPFLAGRGETRRFFHTGANDNYKAWMEGFLASGNGLVILTNGTKGSSFYRELRRAIATFEKWPIGGVIEVPDVHLSEDRLAKLEGVYSLVMPHGVVDERMRIFPGPSAWQIGSENGTLYIAEEGSSSRDALIPADINNFVYETNAQEWVEFVTDGHGQVSRLILRNDLSALEAVRMDRAVDKQTPGTEGRP